jgi:hypothetical protein
MSPQPPHVPQRSSSDPHAQAQVAAAALASAVAVYAVVAWVVVGFLGGGALAGGLPAPLPGVLVAAAAVMLLAAPVVERRIFAAAAGRPGLGEAEVGGDPAERYRLAKLIGFALREAAAVVGLVVGLTTGEPRWTWAISGGTLLLMALAWPRASDLPPSTGGGAGGVVEPR